jgi:glutamate-1-semialdehyde 2,1-aminomutase
MNAVEIDRGHLAELLRSERERFVALHPRAGTLAEQGRRHLLGGVPMPWMTRWPGPYPIVVDRAHGAHFTDIDGLEYVDLCLGDTAAMTGHALTSVAAAVTEQATRGFTTMLPSSDAAWVADELARRFGMARWQLAMTATDANRFVLRFARHLTRRPKVCVMDWCYHGTVDETLVILDEGGRTVSRPGAIGPQVDPAVTTAAVPFNDLNALEQALRTGEIACVLMEPALTNIGIVLPEPGYLEGVRALTKQYCALLVIDETHTICVGPGGCTQAWALEPDLFVIGKPIAGGIPAAAYGMTAEIAAALEVEMFGHDIDVSGVGGTLTGSALALAAVRATLSNSLRAEDFAVAEPLATAWTRGVAEVIEQHQLPWHVQQLGTRAEYWFCPPPRNGAQAAGAVDAELDAFMHLWALNRGILLTPFHNMALFSPFHTEADVAHHTAVFASAVEALVGAGDRERS